MRKNKTKKEIVVDIKIAQETERIRTMVREKLFPFLLELNNTIGYTKIFMQVASVTIDTAFNNLSKEMKVKELIPKFENLYKEDNKDNEMYLKLFNLFGEETVSTFASLMEATPRQIERYFTKDIDTKPIIDLPIDKILG